MLIFVWWLPWSISLTRKLMNMLGFHFLVAYSWKSLTRNWKEHFCILIRRYSSFHKRNCPKYYSQIPRFATWFYGDTHYLFFRVSLAVSGSCDLSMSFSGFGVSSFYWNGSGLYFGQSCFTALCTGQ